MKWVSTDVDVPDGSGSPLKMRLWLVLGAQVALPARYRTRYPFAPRPAEGGLLRLFTQPVMALIDSDQPAYNMLLIRWFG